MLSCGFVCLQHCPYHSELFNHKPQSYRLGFTSVGAYIFAGNIVCVSRLRLVSNDLFFKSTAFAVRLLTLIYYLLYGSNYIMKFRYENYYILFSQDPKVFLSRQKIAKEVVQIFVIVDTDNEISWTE